MGLILIQGLIGSSFALGLVTVLVMAMIITGGYGMVMERLAYRHLRGGNPLLPLISAIGLSIFLQNYVMLAQDARVKSIAPQIEGFFVIMDGVQLGYVQVLIIVLAVLLQLGLVWLIQKTSLGRMQRAVASDAKMAALLGIPVTRVVSQTFIIGGALAAVAGMMVVLLYGVIDFYMGFAAGIKAFTAAVLGGIGSMTGAVLGGLLLGMIETIWAGAFGAEYKNVASFAVLMLVLLVRPQGLFGKRGMEKV
jgi:branched-chain amino acid transport system permease protein